MQFKKGDEVVVKLKRGTVVGKTVDIRGSNNDIIYVREGNEIFKFYIGMNDIKHNMVKDIVTYAESMNKDYDVDYAEQTIVIDGSTNNIVIEYKVCEKRFKMFTVNKERLHYALTNDNCADPHSYASGNTTYRKRLDSAYKFINKFVS